MFTQVIDKLSSMKEYFCTLFCWTGESRLFLSDVNAMGCLHVIVESIATTEDLITAFYCTFDPCWSLSDLPAGGCSFQVYQISLII